jgi:hypothetical protein
VIGVVGQVHNVVDDGDAVRPGVERGVAPAIQERAILVVDDDRMLAPVEDVDAVLGIGCDAGNVAVRPAGWKLLPASDHLILVRALANDHRCGPPSVRPRPAW